VATPGKYKAIVWAKDKNRVFGKVIEAELELPAAKTP
jgi:hypothetical protein